MTGTIIKTYCATLNDCALRTIQGAVCQFGGECKHQHREALPEPSASPAHAPPAQGESMKRGVSIEVYQQDWIPGFAAFGEGSLRARGHAHVVLNLGSLLATVAHKDVLPSELPYVVAECLMHEVIHVLEEWAGVEFSEKRVHALIAKYQQMYKAKPRHRRKGEGK